MVGRARKILTVKASPRNAYEPPIVQSRRIVILSQQQCSVCALILVEGGWFYSGSTFFQGQACPAIQGLHYFGNADSGIFNRHNVRIATHPAFRKFVEEDCGLSFFSVGGDPSGTCFRPLYSLFQPSQSSILCSDMMQSCYPCISTDVPIMTRCVPVIGTKHMNMTWMRHHLLSWSQIGYSPICKGLSVENAALDTRPWGKD